MDKRVLTEIARKHGPKLIEKAIDQLVTSPAAKATKAAGRKPRKPSLGRRIVHGALLRVATKSVPGAIIVGGGLIAKALHDRHKTKQGLHNPGKAGK